MNTTTDITSLLSNVAKAAAPTTIPSTQNLCFRNNQVEATDLQTHIVAPLPSELNCQVNASALIAALKQIENPTITQHEGYILLKTAKGKYKMPCYPADEFPAAPSVQGQPLQVSSEVFASAMQYCSNMVGKDDLRPVMSGIYFGENEIAATDATRLGKISQEQPLSGIILPVKPIRLTQDFIRSNFAVTQSDNHIKIEAFNATIYARLISGNYPKYQAVFPSHHAEFQADAVELSTAIRRLLPYANNSTSLIIFDFEKQCLTAFDIDLNKEASEAFPLPSSAKQIGVNGRFLSDILRTIETPSITIAHGEPNRPIIIKSKNAEFLLMPIILQ
jgi:DNA polymerase-3 subunit beta